MQTPLVNNTFIDHFHGEKYTFQYTKSSELTLLHRQTLSAANTHMQTSTYASHDVNVTTHCAHNNIISRLLTRWDPLERQTALAPPNCPQSARWKMFFFMKTLTASFFFHPSCYQNSGRSLEEGHFIQLSLASYKRRWWGRGRMRACTNREGSGQTSQAASSVHFFFYFYALIREN